METANQSRGLQRYAGGGFISKLFGPTETVTEKFARQDAEFKAKHPERFQAPAPQSAPAPTQGISGYVGNVALDKRMKAAGMAKGGMVKKCVTGGEITGPGGPTDDLVPIMASNGEFMIKAKSAKILGPEVLEALNDLGDEPKNPNDDAAEDAKEVKKMALGGPVEPPINTTPITEQNQQAFNNLQNTPAETVQNAPQEVELSEEAKANGRSMLNSFAPMPIPQLELRNGGMVRKPVAYMAEAGSVEEAARRAEALARIPAGGNAPAPNGSNTGTDFTRNVNNSMNALGGMGVVASVPLKAAAAVPSGLGAIQSSVKAAPMIANGAPGANFIAGANGVRQVGGANLPAVINNGAPVAKAVNVALQEGAKANQMAAATRSLGNASAGMSMLDGQQTTQPAALGMQPQGKTPATPAPSLNAPWYLPEYARAANASDLGGLELERARRESADPAYANDTVKNVLMHGTVGATGAQAPSTTNAPASSTAGAGQGIASVQDRSVNPYATTPPTRGPAAVLPAEAPNDPYSNAGIIAANPGGAVRKTVDANGRTSYSGNNVSGVVGFTDANGKALAGGPKGGFMVSSGMNQEAIKQTLTNPDGSQWSAGDNAIMAANIRDGVYKYLGTSRDPRNAPQMTKSGRAAAVQREQIAMQDKRYGEQNALAQAQFGLNRTKQESDMANEKIKRDLWIKYTTGTPEEKAKAAEQLNMLNGGKQKDQQDEYITNVITNPDGTQSVVATSRSTGQQVQGGQGGQAQPGQYAEGTISTVNGKSAKWIGGKWVPQ